MAFCSSFRSRFECLLPPGDYVLEAASQYEGRHYELRPFRAVELRIQERSKDFGMLELEPAPLTEAERIAELKKTGNWVDVDHTKLFGQPAPKWHAVDARGISKDSQASDIKGKWVLVYFWGTSCVPCLGKGLPALMEFYKTNAAYRDRFEVIGFCVQPDLKSIRELDRELEPIIAANWGGSSLPFPIMLDNTLKTMESFGVNAMGETLLIDPAGRLVLGDSKTLLQKLTEPTERRGD